MTGNNTRPSVFFFREGWATPDESVLILSTHMIRCKNTSMAVNGLKVYPSHTSPVKTQARPCLALTVYLSVFHVCVCVRHVRSYQDICQRDSG